MRLVPKKKYTTRDLRDHMCRPPVSIAVLATVHFSFGVMSNMLTNGELLKKVASGKVGEEQLEKSLSRVIDFCAAGFKQGATKK